jgi:hypothetical protein
MGETVAQVESEDAAHRKVALSIEEATLHQIESLLLLR